MIGPSQYWLKKIGTMTNANTSTTSMPQRSWAMGKIAWSAA